MKPFIKALLSLCMLVAALTPSFASVYTPRFLLTTKYSKEDVRQAIVLNQKWVEYPAYTDRAGWDAFLGDRKADFIEAGEKALDYTWRVIKATDYLEYERSGARLDGDKSANLSALASLLMAELAEGKGRFLDQIINGIYVFSESTSWANTAHNPLQKSKRAIQAWDDPVFDLTAGTTSNLLSWTWYYLHDELDKVDPEISRRLYHELKHRILDVFLTNDSFWWMVRGKDAHTNNWTPWCNYNALNAFMLLENDPERLTDAIWLSMKSVDQFLNSCQEDGACEEGTSYWDRAAGSAYDYLDVLGRITGGKIDFFDHPMIRSLGEYIARSYVGNGWVVNFADASARGGGSPFLIYRYGKDVDSPILKGYAASLYKPEGNISSGADFYRTLAALAIDKELAAEKPAFEHPAYTWYPETDVCYLTDANGLFVATKGGYNNESHNHNDCGTVSFYVNTIPLLIDVGVGTYTRQTFSSERYTIWTMQSNYHNVPMINGVAQRFGDQFRATGSAFDPAKMTYSTDISKAYPEEAQVRKWVRSCSLRGKALTIKDDFVLDKAVAPNVINFMTWGNVDISTPGIVRLAAKGQAAVLEYDARKFTASVETKELPDTRLSNVWGPEVYRVSLTAKAKKTKDSYVFTVKPSTETMDQLTERVFDTAKAQMILMDKRLSDNQMPRTLDKDGQFVPSNLSWWCSGFYPGSLWFVWKYTGDEEVRKLAEKNTLKLDGIKSVAHDHDIGFQINCSFGNALRLTGEPRWAEPVVTAANALAKRFNPATGVIKSWNSKGKNGDWLYPVIIDNMMNLELMMEGYRLSGTDSLKSIATTHANTTIKNHFREDYTTFHVVDYDPVTGAVRHRQTAQGYSDASAWARGQAWGLYGYTMMADKTGDSAYLAQAQAIAKMLISRLPADGVPYWDFDAPDIPNALRDASAGAIIASALVKLSKLTANAKLAKSFADQAELTLRTLASDDYLAPVGENGNFLIRHSVGNLPGNGEVDVPLSYADYYFLEALLRIKGLVD